MGLSDKINLRLKVLSIIFCIFRSKPCQPAYSTNLSHPLSVLICHSDGGVPLGCNRALKALNCVNNHLMLIYSTIPTACQHIHLK